MHSSHNTSIKNWHLQIRGHCYWNQNLVLSEKNKVKKKKKKILKERDSQVCFDIRKETSLRKAIVLLTCFFLCFFWSLYFQKSTNMCVYLYISKKQWEVFHVLNEMSSIYKAAYKPVQTNIVSIYCNLKVAFSKEISENIKKNSKEILPFILLSCLPFGLDISLNTKEFLFNILAIQSHIKYRYTDLTIQDLWLQIK